MKKRIKKIIVQIIIVYICLVGVLYFAQRAMLYFPSKNKPDITPYSTQGVFETTTETKDGLSLSGWMRNPDIDRATVIFFHGNASTLDMTIYKASPYAQAGYGFLLASYRGYGGNVGKPTEQGLYDDARAWINKLQELGIPQNKIIIYGESVGTGVAVQMATEYPDIKALVLESPYTSLPDVAAKTYFFVPVHLLMKDKFNSLSKIKNVTAPLLIMQGLKDKIVPAVLGQKLFSAANDPKEIFQFKEYGHNDMPIESLSEKTIEFLKKH